jgi:hypothetical protein
MEIKLLFEITETEYILQGEARDNMIEDKAKNEWIRVVDNEEVRVEEGIVWHHDWTLVADDNDKYYLEVWIDVDVQDLWQAAQSLRSRLSEYES